MEDTRSSAKILTSIVVLVILLMAATALALARSPGRPYISFQPAAHAAQPAFAAHITYKGKNGKTALDLLKAEVKVSTRQSSYGEYIDSIDGVQSGKDGKYWEMYVNGSQAPIAANSYMTRDGDEIEWRLQ